MDETLLGKFNQGVRLQEREQRQRLKEIINEVVLEGGLKIKEEEPLPIMISDIDPNNEVLPTPKRNNWK